MAATIASSVTSLNGTSDTKLDQDYKREVDQRRKYALGVEDTGSRLKPVHPRGNRVDRVYNAKENHKAGLNKKRPAFEDSDAVTSDSSAEEDVQEASVAPVPDADVAYSFDASHGPSQGSGILTMAINKAMERYENKATEKLVKTEYEIIRKEKEAETVHNQGYAADEDDYELV